MNWDDLKKRFNEVLKNPADFDSEAVVTLIQELEQFAIENIGTSDAGEADKAASQLRNVLRNYKPNIINRYVASSHHVESEPTHDSETTVKKGYIEQAEDAYYSGEWAKAIELCQQVLKEDPTNSWAREHIEKARINQIAVGEDAKIPREAKQLYRRARSLIIAKQSRDAAQHLHNAISIAEKSNVRFPKAEELLDSMESAVLADEFNTQARFAIENSEWSKALDLLHRALELDGTDNVANILATEISLIVNIQREIALLSNESSCDSPLYREILDDLNAIKHPWLLDANIVERLQSEIAQLRKQKSDNFELNGRNQLEHAKDALYLSVMSELSGQAIENFECALECNPQKIDIPGLISEAKSLKDKVDSIINGDVKSLLDFLQERTDRQKTLNEITKRMEMVISEFDKGSEEYKSLWQQLESLFDKRTKSLNASEDRVAVVLAKVDAEIKNIRNRRPWGTTLVIAILLIIVSGILLAINPKRTMVPFPADFPADLVLYASLFGSAIRVVVELFDRSRTKWVDTVRLTVLRPLIGMGVTVLIVLFVYAGLGTILAFSPAMGFWGYVSLSSILGYSDSIMNKIITILEKGISIKV